jgi:hypothetical protein
MAPYLWVCLAIRGNYFDLVAVEGRAGSFPSFVVPLLSPDFFVDVDIWISCEESTVMPDRSNERRKRRTGVIPLAAPVVEETISDVFFEQPLVDEAQHPAAADPGPTGGPKSGKAKATKLGKAKLSAIAKKVTRSRWKKKR